MFVLIFTGFGPGMYKDNASLANVNVKRTFQDNLQNANHYLHYIG